jgi:hypothetical protein
MGPEEFLRLDEHEKPVNCGVTRYFGKAVPESRGRLELERYNQQYYDDAEIDG